MQKKEQSKNRNTGFGKPSDLQKFIIKYEEKFNTLTDREVEILTLIAKGINKPAIAQQLDISRLEVQNYRLRIQSKLGIENNSDYLKYALAFSLISF